MADLIIFLCEAAMVEVPQLRGRDADPGECLEGGKCRPRSSRPRLPQQAPAQHAQDVAEVGERQAGDPSGMAVSLSCEVHNLLRNAGKARGGARPRCLPASNELCNRRLPP